MPKDILPIFVINMKLIPLTQGKFAMVDDDDFEKVNQYKWFVRKGNNTFYASTWIGKWRSRKYLHMHHLINGNPKKGMVVDHGDRNGLNNQKYNLRECTNMQNSTNRTGWGASKYLGVSISNLKGHIYWRAFISINKKNTYLGFFRTPEEAAIAYNEAAIKYHGEFANLNKINNASFEKG